MSNALTLFLHLPKYLKATLSAGMHLHYYCRYICAGGCDQACSHSVRKMQMHHAANTAGNELPHKRQGLYTVQKQKRVSRQTQTEARRQNSHACTGTHLGCVVNELLTSREEREPSSLSKAK